MEVLKGDLRYFEIIDLLNFLTKSKVEGVVHFDNGYEVWVKGEEIVGAKPSLEKILGLKKGKFVFSYEKISIPPFRMPFKDVKKLYDKILKEQKKYLRNVLPGWESIPIVKISETLDKIELTKDEWNIFSLIDGKHSLEKIFQRLGGYDKIEFLKIMAKLYVKGAIDFKVKKGRLKI